MYTHVVYSDISESRLAIGKKMGADQIVVVDSRDARAVAAKIVDAMGAEPDITIECSGAESSIQSAIYVSRLVISLVVLSFDTIIIPFFCWTSRQSQEAC